MSFFEYTIQFSHNYPKLHNQKQGELLKVILIAPPLTVALIEYDTQFFTGDGDINYYPLPKSSLIILVFLGNLLIPFTTIRRYTPEKMDYYNSLVGENFNITIMKKGD